ncbi:MAG: MAPEG family protein [Hasllibacter sp.]
MTPELFWLTLTMILAASLWVPFIVLVNTTEAGAQVDNGLAGVAAMPRPARMANRAHLNLLEQSMPFAALILLAHALGVTSAVTVWAAAAFFFLRVAHAAIMLLDMRQIPIRPIVFTLAWACVLAIGVEVLRLG